MHIDSPSHTIEQIKKNNTNDTLGLIPSSSDNVGKENLFNNLTSFMVKAPIFLSLKLPCATSSKQKMNNTILLNLLLDCIHSCID